MIKYINKYPFFVAAIFQISVFQFIPFNTLGGIVESLLVVVFSWIWAFGVGDRELKKLIVETVVSHVPVASNIDQSSVVMRVVVYDASRERDKKDAPILCEGVVLGPAGFVDYVENMLLKEKETR